jgi:ribosomal protein S18 acetylase RimI-like enzyme
MIKYVRENLGYKYIWLEVSSKNTRGIAFYEREGFKKVGVKANILVMLQGFGKLITMRMESEAKR